MAEFDLTSRISPYLDRHLVLGLMEFIVVRKLYDTDSLLKEKLSLLDKTKMVDYSVDVYQQLHPEATEAPKELSARRVEVLNQLRQVDEETEPLLNILNNEENHEVIEETRDAATLLEILSEKGFKMEMLEKLYKSAKFLFDTGNYTSASQYLNIVRMLLPLRDRNFMNAMWGKLASDILLQEWDNSMEDVKKLQEAIDGNVSAPLVLLQQRTWLIHWSLFVFHNHQEGTNLIIDTFLYKPNYLNTIQTTCPHILRYLTAAVVTSRSRRAEKHQKDIKDLVKVIQQESYTYNDPVTDFISCLYHHFDFEGAQKKLVECKTLIINDFFLVGCYKEFIENARLLIFETFCKIRNRISIKMLAEKLDMLEEGEAERWIVNLIRNARLDAKIDSKQGLVIMGTQPVSPYQQVVEKTKNLAFKTQKLVMDIKKNFADKEVEVNQWNE